MERPAFVREPNGESTIDVLCDGGRMLFDEWIGRRRAAVSGHNRKERGENCQTGPEPHNEFDTGCRPAAPAPIRSAPVVLGVMCWGRFLLHWQRIAAPTQLSVTHIQPGFDRNLSRLPGCGRQGLCGLRPPR